MTALVRDIQKVREAYSYDSICAYRGRFVKPLEDEKGFYAFMHAELYKSCRVRCFWDLAYNRPGGRLDYKAGGDHLRREWLATCTGNSIITPEWVEATLATYSGTSKFLKLIDDTEMLLKSDPQMRLCLALTTAWQRQDSGYDVPYTALIRSVRQQIQPYLLLEGYVENLKERNSLPTDWEGKTLYEIRLNFLEDWRNYYS